jgi:serine phosphatase RsbU (regulator of sigma subunit)
MFRPNSPPVRYGVAVFATALAFLLVLMVQAVVRPEFPGQIASPLFLLAVVVSAWHGGTGPGLVAAVLSYLTLDYFFLLPVYSFDPGWEDIPTATVYLLTALVVSILEARRRRAEKAVRRSERQMCIARTIQAHLLPQAPPNVPGFDIAGVFHPAEATGGDYFDFIPLSGGGIGIVVGDVSGHGFPSALVMAETRACLRTLALAHNSVGEILTRTNALLVEDMADQLFVTLFLACIHPTGRSLAYAAAGQEACLLHATGRWDRLRSTSLPLGVAKDVVVPQASGSFLEDGDVLLLVTDGVLEARCEGGELFGLERTIEAVNANRTKSARELVDCLVEAVRAFSGRIPQEDDITAVIVKVSAQATRCDAELATLDGESVAAAVHPMSGRLS